MLNQQEINNYINDNINYLTSNMKQFMELTYNPNNDVLLTPYE